MGLEMSSSKTKQKRKGKLPLLLRVRLILRSMRTSIVLPLITFEPVPMAIPVPLFTLFDDVSRSRQNVDFKIQEANESLSRTMDVIDELRTLMAEKTAELAVLKREYEKYAKLAGIEKRKARVIMDQVEQSLNKRKRIERLVGLATSIAAGLVVFVLGILFGPVITSYLGALVRLI